MTLPMVNRRKNPPGMLRHLRKIDLWKTLGHKFSAEVRALVARFPDILPAGARATDFTLPSTAGDTVSLSDYRGKKHVVLEFGSIT